MDKLVNRLLSQKVNINDAKPTEIIVSVKRGRYGEYVFKIQITQEMEEAIALFQKSGEYAIILPNIPSVMKAKTPEKKTEILTSLLPEPLRDNALYFQWYFGSQAYVAAEEGNYPLAQEWLNYAPEWAKKHGHKPSEFMKGVYEQFKLLGGTDREWLSASLGFDVSRIKEANELNELLRSASKTLEPDYLFVYIETVLKPLFGGTEEMQVGEAFAKSEEFFKNMLSKAKSEESLNMAIDLIRKTVEFVDILIEKAVSKNQEALVEKLKELKEKLEDLVK